MSSPERAYILEVAISADLLAEIETLATHEQCDLTVMAKSLLESGVADRFAYLQANTLWQTLTQREQEVAALACLGYANPQIAAVLTLSVNTIKTHLRHLLRKFKVGSKAELQRLLAHWDFSEWLHARQISLD